MKNSLILCRTTSISHTWECFNLGLSQLLLPSDPHSYFYLSHLGLLLSLTLSTVIALWSSLLPLSLTPGIAFIFHSLNCYCPLILTLTSISHTWDCFYLSLSQLLLPSDPHSYLYRSLLELLLSLTLSTVIALWSSLLPLSLTTGIAFISQSLNCYCPLILALTSISHNWDCFYLSLSQLLLPSDPHSYLYLSHLGLLLSHTLSTVIALWSTLSHLTLLSDWFSIFSARASAIWLPLKVLLLLWRCLSCVYAARSRGF
jgi:hypothetical protein